jgi:hypothetical protein
MLPGVWPIETIRSGKHDMWKVKFPVHSVRVACIEESRESIEALRRIPDKLGFRFLRLLRFNKLDEVAHFTSLGRGYIITSVMLFGDVISRQKKNMSLLKIYCGYLSYIKGKSILFADSDFHDFDTK